MRKLKAAFYFFGFFWLAGALMMLSYISKADLGGPLLGCYIKSAASGLVSASALLIAQELYHMIRRGGGWRDDI